MRIVCMVLALLLSAPRVDVAIGASHPQHPLASYVCPMHPDIRSDAPGTCQVCGMTLVAADPHPAGGYDVDVRTPAEGVVAGRPFRLVLAVREPAGALVRQFTEVHDKRFHLFVISQDMEHYAHVHPEQQPDGAWAIDVTLPRPGYYKLYSDFLPQGGMPQVIGRTLVTSGFHGDPATSAATLVPDRSLEHTLGNMTVSLALPAAGLIAGREETFVYRITDPVTGAPVTDIEPYLGAWGHSLLMSEDTTQVVHAHPVENVHGGAATGGPTLTFKARLPKPGRYRIWTQIKRRGDVATAVFTVAARGPLPN